MKVFLAGANGKKKLLELYDNVLGIWSNKVASALESACTDRQTYAMMQPSKKNAVEAKFKYNNCGALFTG